MMAVAYFTLFYQIGAMVLLISPEQIELDHCACTQTKAFEEGYWWIYPDDAGDSSVREKRGKPD